MKYPKFRGKSLVITIYNMTDFQQFFQVSSKEMEKAGAYGFTENNDYDANVIRKILRKRGNYLVRFIDTKEGGYFEIYR